MRKPILRIENLTKTFGKRKVVDRLSFVVNEGDIFGFLGPNGAGKSTTIRMIVSLIKPETGDVEVFGRSVRRFKTKTLAGVGALIEKPDFYKNLSARHNLEILARMENVPFNRVSEVLDIVGLADRCDDKVKAYSQGMKQRLGIAQALLSKPKLLILDEPTNGLDPKGMKEVRDLIRSLVNEGMTVFLSSHLLNEVQRICTALAIIDHGKLITVGKVDDLLNETNFFTTEIHAKPLAKTKEILSEFEWISNLIVEGESIKVQVAYENLPQITKALVKQGVELSAIIPRTSLEEYFLLQTGTPD